MDTHKEIKPNTVDQLTHQLHVGETKRAVITPQLAQDLFDRRLITRTIKPDHVAAIAADMKDGYWIEKSPIPIIIDPRGVVLDGQHRLSALLALNLPVVLSISMVSAQVAEELIRILDTGISRSPADRLRVEFPDMANSREVVAWIGAMCLMAYRTTKLHKVKSRIGHFYQVLQEPLAWCNQHRIRPSIVQGAAAFAWVTNPEAATQFAMQFTGDADRPASSPVAALERTLREGTYGSVHASRYGTAAKVVAAIDALAEGRSLKRLAASEDTLSIYREGWRAKYPDLDIELTTAGVQRGRTMPSMPSVTASQIPSRPSTSSMPAVSSGVHGRGALTAPPPRARGRPRKTG